MATTVADDDPWDEHASWMALLHDDDDAASADRTTLVDRLVPAFAAHHNEGKEYIKHAFIPVVQHAMQLHDAIHNDIFPRHAQGLAAIGESDLRFETAARRDMNAAQAAHDDAKRSLDALFATLADLVRESDLLFQTFKTNMHERAQRLRFYTNQIPVDAERLIASLDNKAKHLGAEDHAKAKESLLRGILEKY